MYVRRAGTDKDQMLHFLSAQGKGTQQLRPLSGVEGFGIAWALIIQIAGWIIQGIGLGLSVAESIQQAKAEKDRQMPGQSITSGNLDDMAAQLSILDTQGRPTTYWRQQLRTGDFGETAPACPEGSIWNAISKRCELIAKAGMFGAMPTWGWLLLGVGGFYILTQTGIIQLARRR